MAYTDRVTKVLDGDTFERQSNSSVNVRLKDVYAPELNEDGGYAAKWELERIIDNESVTINETGKTYNRVEARVVRNRDNLNVNQHMINYLRRN